MSEASPLESIYIAADPVEARAVCDGLRAVDIDARAVWDDAAASLEIFVPAATADRARQIIAEGHWPRLA